MTFKMAVVTSTRAEYGLLFWLMRELQNDHEVDFKLIVTGAHLSHEFGFTVSEIIEDGFEIDWQVDMMLSSDNNVAISKSLGLSVIGFADAFNQISPDAVILLGDRYEIFGAAQAAFLTKIPIVHLHGGEVTLGAYDNAFRHSISQMSALHFVAREEYRQRLIKMDIDENKVFVSGPMCLDAMMNLELPNKDELEEFLGMTLENSLFVVTYHPETLSELSSEQQIDELLSALGSFPESTIVFTGANADTDGRIINQRVKEFCVQAPDKRVMKNSLGIQRYWALLKISDLMIGNSSSGIIEAPLLGVKVLNIGNRQKDRICEGFVVHSACEKAIIKNEINKLLKIPKQNKNEANFIEPTKIIVPKIKNFLRGKKV